MGEHKNVAREMKIKKKEFASIYFQNVEFNGQGILVPFAKNKKK